MRDYEGAPEQNYGMKMQFEQVYSSRLYAVVQSVGDMNQIDFKSIN